MEKVKKITALIICGAMLIQALGLMTPIVYGAENLEEEDITAQTSTVSAGDEFSNAEFEVEKGVSAGVELNIKNVQITDTNADYRLIITNSTTKPNATGLDDISVSNGWKNLIYNATDKSFKPVSIEEYMELNDNMYIWVVKHENSGEISFVVNGKPIEHLEIPKDSRLFTASFITHRDNQLVFHAPKASTTKRKFTYKIGEIKDSTILNDIKNEKSNGFDALLNYAKQQDYILTGTLNVTSTVGNSYYGNDIDLTGKLEEGKYYYVYVLFDDEGGKYYPIEGVTLGKADIPENWYLFLYGEASFNWDNFESGKAEPNGGETTQTDDGKKDDGKKDDTVAKDPIPQTGQTAIITIAVILALAGMGALIKYKNIQLK